MVFNRKNLIELKESLRSYLDVNCNYFCNIDCMYLNKLFDTCSLLGGNINRCNNICGELKSILSKILAEDTHNKEKLKNVLKNRGIKGKLIDQFVG